MNFFGHCHAAALAGESPACCAGAMLPDLASMVRIRLAGVELPRSLVRGVRIHHRSDEAFHGHRSVVAAMSSMRVAMEADGVPRGAARAAAHVGYEMMFDHALWSLAAERTFQGALPHAASAAAAFPGEDGERLVQLCDGLATQRDPRHLESATWIAERIAALTAWRPRIRVEPEHLAIVAAVLEDGRGEIALDAPSILAEVVAAITSGTRPSVD